MLNIAVAHTLELDMKDAIEDLLTQCQEQLGELIPQAGLLFTGIDLDYPAILNGINKAYPGIDLIGCTDYSELSSVQGVADDSICLTLFYSNELTFRSGIAENIFKDPYRKIKKAIKTTVRNVEQKPDLCIVTPTSHFFGSSGTKFLNILDLVNGMKQNLGENFPIIGGAGVHANWKGDTQFHNEQFYHNAVPFLLIYGPIKYSLGVASGWVPIGKKTKISKADGCNIFRIGEQTALDFYRHYLGEFDFMGMLEYPLAIFDEGEENFYLKAPTLFDAEEGSIHFQTTIPEGATVQLTHSTRDKVIEGVKESVDSAISQYSGERPSIALCFTCMARKIVLGTRVQEEYEVLKAKLPDIPFAGFYTGGEIGPLAPGKPTRHHNETFLTLLLGTE